eukprot:15462792-Alexandrium_andersonii.AAC.1
MPSHSWVRGAHPRRRLQHAGGRSPTNNVAELVAWAAALALANALAERYQVTCSTDSKYALDVS